MEKNSVKNRALINEANQHLSWTLTNRQECDLELLLNGGFEPLNGFMIKSDYESVLNECRLKNGKLWSMPIVLDINHSFYKKIKNKSFITLKNTEGFALAILKIEDIWRPNIENEAFKIYSSNDNYHPGVGYLKKKINEYYVGGSLRKISLPNHHDFNELRHTPEELKLFFKKNNWNKIVAFQTRNPLHKAHIEMTNYAMKELNAKILIHPAVGQTKNGDIDYFTRVRCYKEAMKKYSKNNAFLSLLPIAMRMAGPREAIWHAQIRKNYGCTHMIIGRDHAGPGNSKDGTPFYEPLKAQKDILKYKSEIGIEVVEFNFMVYIPSQKNYKSITYAKKKQLNYKTLSGTELRKLLDMGKEIPEWFTYKEVAHELKKAYPPLIERGLTVFFTGLSGSGKSTLANGLLVKLKEEGSRPVTLLDGDIVRTNLSSELGFSKEHRSLNIKRIGFVASEITKNRGIAICAPIAPYENDRMKNRRLISQYGGYFEIYVNTSIKKCEERDVKGLYRLARKGVIKEFTGISDPYEIPKNPDMIINSSGIEPNILVEKIFKKIKKLGYIN